MAELKTKVTTESVQHYLDQIENEAVRNDCKTICNLMESLTGQSAKMWGPAIIGVGHYRYQYDSGRSNDWFLMGFSPRKANISLYILGCDVNSSKYQEILSRLGKHKTGKSCLYVNRLSDINVEVLKELCEVSSQDLMNR